MCVVDRSKLNTSTHTSTRQQRASDGLGGGAAAVNTGGEYKDCAARPIVVVNTEYETQVIVARESAVNTEYKASDEAIVVNTNTWEPLHTIINLNHCSNQGAVSLRRFKLDICKSLFTGKLMVNPKKWSSSQL